MTNYGHYGQLMFVSKICPLLYTSRKLNLYLRTNTD